MIRICSFDDSIAIESVSIVNLLSPARALAISPTVILADEPTGNLDAENAEEVVLLLSKAARIYNQTIIMVTHDRQMADYAERVIYIKDGVITKP